MMDEKDLQIHAAQDRETTRQFGQGKLDDALRGLVSDGEIGQSVKTNCGLGANVQNH